jgi:electron transfer flavoprotein alpha subunit
MTSLIIVEHDNQTIQPSTRQILNAALCFKDKPVFLVVGYQCEAVAKTLATMSGVEEVWHVDNVCYQHQLAENLSELIVSLMPSFSRVLASATCFGKNILPRVAAMLDVAQVSDVTRIIDDCTFEHPIYAGNAVETVRVLDNIKVLTIRTTAFDPVMTTQSPCSILKKDVPFSTEKTRFIERQLSQSSRPELSNAKIIVAGGRGLQSAEKFKLIEELADCLNAAVGASRAAVDAGFVPNDYQVGQTGKVVAPTLYIAIGISGAIQHLAGMKESKIIVAINKDEEAPIFQIASYGLVGDLFALVPELIEQLKQR